MVTSRQDRFTIGEIDPLLTARYGVDFYQGALEKARNVSILPDGGFRRRPGSRNLGRIPQTLIRFAAPTITAPNGGTTANANDNDPATLLTTTSNISTITNYVVVQYDLGANQFIEFVDIVAASLSAGSNADEFKVQVSTDNAAWTTAVTPIAMSTTAITARRRVHQAARYIRFVRVGTTDLGTAKASIGEMSVWQATGTLSQCRLIDYKFNIEQRYMMVFSDQNIAVYKDKVLQVDIPAPLYTSNKMGTLNWTSGGDTLLLFHEDVAPYKLQRQGADNAWSLSEVAFENIPFHDFVPVTTTPATTLTPSAVSGKVTLTAGAATFNAGHVNQIVDGNGGTARITKYTSGTVVEAITEVPFYTASAIASGDWTLETGWEDVWSTARGWPRSGCFFQQRLFIGGSKSRPRTLWGSCLGDPFNFSSGSFRATDAIDIDVDNEEPIVNVLAHRTLQIFSTGGELAVIQPRGSAVTPDNPGVLPQTEQGSQPGLRPIVSNGATLFVQRGGKSISKLLFSDVEQAFTSTSVSIYSSHLLRTPVAFTLRRSTSTEECDWMVIANSDGTIAVGSLLAEQNVQGFALWSTDGSYKNVGVDIDEVYTVVTREIDGGNNNYLEIFDETYFTDASIKFTTGLPTDTFTGLDFLEGKEVRVIADGNILPNQTVVGGSITTSREGATGVEIGLDFAPLVKTLPYENQVVGDTIGNKKRISQCTLRLYETSEIFVNDVPVSMKSFDNTLLGGANPIFTGEKKVEGLRGWDTYGQLEITQQNPLPMTVLAIGMKVDL